MWQITTVKPTSKCHVLIDEELPEDSSDEEYQPNQEQEQVRCTEPFITQ